MKKLENLELRHFSKEKWLQIEEAIERGDELALIRLVEPTVEKTKEERLEETKVAIELNSKNLTQSEIQYHIYNNINYEMPIELIMDALSKFARENGIPKNALRFAVEHIDEDYTVKHQAQYSAAVREFVNEADKNAMLTNEDRVAYYEEERLIEEDRKEFAEEHNPFEEYR